MVLDLGFAKFQSRLAKTIIKDMQALMDSKQPNGNADPAINHSSIYRTTGAPGGTRAW